jgi:hypothetical protein
MENLFGLDGCKEPDILRNIGLVDKQQVKIIFIVSLCILIH